MNIVNEQTKKKQKKRRNQIHIHLSVVCTCVCLVVCIIVEKKTHFFVFVVFVCILNTLLFSAEAICAQRDRYYLQNGYHNDREKRQNIK